LMQEFGLCTAPRGEPGRTITDEFLGAPCPQYLASEDEGAEYYRGVLERLARTGATGAYAWCYADYDARIFDRPPLATAIRERTCGIVRADGSEKPVCAVLRAFAAKLARGDVALGQRPRVLDVPTDTYYTDPAGHCARLYHAWCAR